MLNKIIIQGRLVKDLDIKKTNDGYDVSTFTIACERDFKSKETGRREADFFDVVMWGDRARFVSENFKQGDMMILCGRLKTRDYEKDGVKRRVVEITEADVNFCGSTKSKENREEFKMPDLKDDSPFM